LCTAPGKMMSPACRPSPKAASLFASHATQRTGLPRAAAPAPVSASAPLREMTTPMSLGSMPASLRMLPPTANMPEEALSATVSMSLISQLATRLSTISTAGSAPAIAVSARAAVTPGPSRSRSMTRATSASMRGWISLPSGTSSPSSTTM
jgi:hypothetical protein